MERVTHAEEKVGDQPDGWPFLLHGVHMTQRLACTDFGDLVPNHAVEGAARGSRHCVSRSLR
jgi:hypothetical protein